MTFAGKSCKRCVRTWPLPLGVSRSYCHVCTSRVRHRLSPLWGLLGADLLHHPTAQSDFDSHFSASSHPSPASSPLSEAPVQMTVIHTAHYGDKEVDKARGFLCALKQICVTTPCAKACPRGAAREKSDASRGIRGPARRHPETQPAGACVCARVCVDPIKMHSRK